MDQTDLKTASGRPIPVTAFTRGFFFWACLWMVLGTIVMASLFVLARLVSRKPSTFRRFAAGWARAMFVPTGVRVSKDISPEVEPGGVYVFVANHQSAIDIPALCLALPSAFGFVAKAELEHVPFLGTALRMSPSVFVDWRDPRRSLDSVRQVAQQIKEGASVIIFAEGVRQYGPEMTQFKKSAFVLAREGEIPVVPVTIVNAFEILDERRKVARPGVIRVIASAPIMVEADNAKDLKSLIDEVADRIQAGVYKGLVTDAQAHADTASD